MHRTSSTNLSDTMIQLQQFGKRLEDARWMPTEELMSMLAAGAMVLDSVFEHTAPDVWTQDEQDFIDNLHSTITDHINEISTSENYE